jgi:hypothetical protein
VVEEVLERDLDDVFEVRVADQPMEFVLDEMCRSLVDDDEFDFGWEPGVEPTGEGHARVAGAENDDSHTSSRGARAKNVSRRRQGELRPTAPLGGVS